MSLKDHLLGLFEKQSLWVPYQGDYGGEGWMNVQTGEIRYQENRPSDEGVPEEEDPQFGPYQGDEELGETVPADDYGPVDMDLVEEGDPVIVENGDQSVVAEVVGEGDDGTVDVDMGEYGIQPMPEESILGAPAMEPPDGPAEGWMERPDEISHDTYEEGQVIEVYDADAGEYVMAEVDFLSSGAMDARVTETDEWTPSEDSEYEVGDVFTVNEDMEGDRFVTAAEDPDYEAMDLGDSITETDDLLAAGDEVWIEHDSLTDGPVVGFVGEDKHDRLAVEFEADDGSERSFVPELHGWDNDQIEVWDNPTEFLSGKEFKNKFLMATDRAGYDLLDGHETRLDHPTFGEVSGEVETHVDDEGNFWLSVVEYDDPEEGDWVEFEHPTYDTTVEGEVSQIQDDQIVMDTDPDDPSVDYMTVDPDAVESEVVGEYSATLNPDHPYSLLDMDHEVADPTQTVRDPAEELKIGDYVEYDEDIRQVENVGPDGDIRIDGRGWVSPDQLEGGEGIVQESLEPPAEAPDDRWAEMPASAEHGLAAGDYVYYHDPEANEMRAEQVEDIGTDSEVVTEDGARVHRDDMQGFVSSLPANEVSPEYISRGEYVEFMDTNRETHEGIVVGSGGNGRNAYINVMDENGDEEKIYPNQGQHAVVGYDDEYEGTLGASTPAITVEDGEVVDERDTSEVVSEIKENIDYSQREASGQLEKSGELAKNQKKKIKNNLYAHFGVQPVEDFYHMKARWKSNSGGDAEAATLARAYKDALGIRAEAREGGAAPDPEMVKLADTVAEMSQDYYREVFGEEAMLSRGSSKTAWESFADDFLSEPHREEYNLNFLAMNNHTTDKQGTADKWNAFTAERSVDAESVASMTDFIFETNYESENEIGVVGDDQTVSIDGIYPGHANHGDRDEPMTADIDEWNGDLTHNFFASMANGNGTFAYENLGVGQMENLKRIVEKSYEHDVEAAGNSAVNNELEAARQALRDNGFEFEWEQESGWDVDDFEGISEFTNYEPGNGVPASFWDETHNEVADGEVMGVHDGEVMVWDEGGTEHSISPDNLTFVDEVDLNNYKDRMGRITPDEMVGEMSTDPESLDPLDEVYYAFSANSDEAQEGTITSVEDGMVEISGPMGGTEYFDADEVQNGHVVLQDQASGSADGSDGGFDEVEDYEDGMEVEWDTGISTGEGHVQYTGDDWVYVEDNHGEVHTMHPDDLTITDDAHNEGIDDILDDTFGDDDANGDSDNSPLFDLDEGDTVTFDDGFGNEHTGTFLGENDGPAAGNYTVETENGTVMGFDEDQVIDTETVSDGSDEPTDDGGGGWTADDDLSFEEGEFVRLDNDLPSSHPDSMDEVGSLGEPMDNDGQTIFPVHDATGTLINEYTPQELAQIAEPAVTGSALRDAYGEGEDVYFEDPSTGDIVQPQGFSDNEVYYEVDGTQHSIHPEEAAQHAVAIGQTPEGVEATDDDGLPTPEQVNGMELAEGETFQMETMGGIEDFVVMEGSGTPADPVEIEDQEYGDRFLLWPDGELEQL